MPAICVEVREQFVESFLFFHFARAPGMKLSLSGLHGKHFHKLSHLSGPTIFGAYVEILHLPQLGLSCLLVPGSWSLAQLDWKHGTTCLCFLGMMNAGVHCHTCLFT